MESPRISVVISSFRNYNQLMNFIYCMKNQTNQNYLLWILNDEIDEQLRQKILPHIDKNMVWCENTGEPGLWGYPTKNSILEHINTDYVLFSNQDNYYVPKLIEKIDEIIELENPDIIHIGMIHNYIDYKVFQVRNKHFDVGGIDLGQFVCKTNLVKEFGFVPDPSKSTPEGAWAVADGILARRITSKYPDLKIIYLNSILFVHN